MGNLVYQTENWDLTNQTSIIMNIIKGDPSFVLSDGNFSVFETTAEGF